LVSVKKWQPGARRVSRDELHDGHDDTGHAHQEHLLAVGGVVCALLAMALAWVQLAHKHDEMVLATGIARAVQVDPLGAHQPAPEVSR
jgi:hypothetical protein